MTTEGLRDLKKILVVDDDIAVGRLLDAVLTHAGFLVTLVEDGPQALAALDTSFDVLLCDKNLPGMQGTQVVLEARQRFPNLATVLMTADPQALALGQLGLDGYLAKPFRSNALAIHTVTAALERREQTIERQQLERQLAATRDALQKRG